MCVCVHYYIEIRVGPYCSAPALKLKVLKNFVHPSDFF